MFNLRKNILEMQGVAHPVEGKTKQSDFTVNRDLGWFLEIQEWSTNDLQAQH